MTRTFPQDSREMNYSAKQRSWPPYSNRKVLPAELQNGSGKLFRKQMELSLLPICRGCSIFPGITLRDWKVETVPGDLFTAKANNNCSSMFKLSHAGKMLFRMARNSMFHRAAARLIGEADTLGTLNLANPRISSASIVIVPDADRRSSDTSSRRGDHGRTRRLRSEWALRLREPLMMFSARGRYLVRIDVHAQYWTDASLDLLT